MEVPELVSELRDFGDAEATGLEDGNVVFHLECNLKSKRELEEVTEYIDNIYPEKLVLTGRNKKSLFVIKVDCARFSTIPPYLYQGWSDTDMT